MQLTKTNMQKSTVFLYSSNERSEKDIKRTISFTPASERQVPRGSVRAVCDLDLKALSLSPMVGLQIT